MNPKPILKFLNWKEQQLNRFPTSAVANSRIIQLTEYVNGDSFGLAILLESISILLPITYKINEQLIDSKDSRKTANKLFRGHEIGYLNKLYVLYIFSRMKAELGLPCYQFIMYIQQCI